MDVKATQGRMRGSGRAAVILGGASLAGLCASAMMAGSARADGTASGKYTLVVDCNGLGSVTISVPIAKGASGPVWGAGQIVGSSEHLLPTSFSESVSDQRTGAVIFTFAAQQASGSSHPNQQTTTCSFTHTGTFSQLAPPGTPMPPGVQPDDILVDTFTVTAIVEP